MTTADIAWAFALAALPAVLAMLVLFVWALASAFMAWMRRRTEPLIDWRNDNPGGDEIVGNIMERL